MVVRSRHLVCIYLLIFATIAPEGFASPLTDALAWWQPPRAFLCHLPNVDFPSKFSATDSTNCDDGDMTLFNGMICASGDQRGCDGVRLAQGGDGRWWRSPRRIGWTYPSADVSFSPDQALGVMLYTAVVKDVAAFDHWAQWLDDNRPCIVEIGGNCLQKGWLRYCTDDVPDKRCTLRPGDCAFLTATGKYIGSSRVDLCEMVLKELNLPSSFIPSVPSQVLASASVNETGFPLHLAAVTLLLARTLGINDPDLDKAGQILAARQDQNPFFQYLATGATSGTITLLLNLCPNPNRPSNGRNQWSWERDQKDKAWLNSMYWDCIFLGSRLN
jgi:hypothetical protein